MKRNVLLILLTVFFFQGTSFSQTTKHPIVPKFWQWAPTPPMGWNSWDCYGPTVTGKEVRANANFMAQHLKKYGWKYIVVDIRWYVNNSKSHGYNEKNPAYSIDKYGRFIPSPQRFPSSANGQGFKPLASYIHHLGLKFGIHVMRGIPRIAVKKNMPIYGTPYYADDIYDTLNLCPWLHDMYSVNPNKKGAQAYYNSLFDLYASWGVDFVKVDDLSRPYHKSAIEMIRKAIDQCGRAIVLSTSPGETPISEAKNIEHHANMWRIINDFWDDWPQVKQHFALFEKWIPYAGYGHWPDGDMLPLGHIGIRAERGGNRMSRLTHNEQYTLMTLFAMCKSPLMFGGDLPSSDAFTLSLITNPDVIYINQHSTHNHLILKDKGIYIWAAEAPNGDKYLAIFNTPKDQKPQQIKINNKLIDINPAWTVTNLWSHKKLGRFKKGFSTMVPHHGVKLFRFSDVKYQNTK